MCDVDSSGESCNDIKLVYDAQNVLNNCYI